MSVCLLWLDGYLAVCLSVYLSVPVDCNQRGKGVAVEKMKRKGEREERGVQYSWKCVN